MISQLLAGSSQRRRGSWSRQRVARHKQLFKDATGGRQATIRTRKPSHWRCAVRRVEDKIANIKRGAASRKEFQLYKFVYTADCKRRSPRAGLALGKLRSNVGRWIQYFCAGRPTGSDQHRPALRFRLVLADYPSPFHGRRFSSCRARGFRLLGDQCSRSGAVRPRARQGEGRTRRFALGPCVGDGRHAAPCQP